MPVTPKLDHYIQRPIDEIRIDDDGNWRIILAGEVQFINQDITIPLPQFLETGLGLMTVSDDGFVTTLEWGAMDASGEIVSQAVTTFTTGMYSILDPQRSEVPLNPADEISDPEPYPEPVERVLE